MKLEANPPSPNASTLPGKPKVAIDARGLSKRFLLSGEKEKKAGG